MFVDQLPGGAMLRDPAALASVHTYSRNVALWLAGVDLASTQARHARIDGELKRAGKMLGLPAVRAAAPAVGSRVQA